MIFRLRIASDNTSLSYIVIATCASHQYHVNQMKWHKGEHSCQIPIPLGVFGFPAGHILSPVLHNKAAEELGLDYHYLAYEVRPDNLEEAVRGAKVMGFRGLTITIPHKVAVAKFMDELSEDARLMGAVNTIVFEENGNLIGHNTDGIGWLQFLRETTGGTSQRKEMSCFGCGRSRESCCRQNCPVRSDSPCNQKSNICKSFGAGALCGEERSFCQSRGWRLG